MFAKIDFMGTIYCGNVYSLIILGLVFVMFTIGISQEYTIKFCWSKRCQLSPYTLVDFNLSIVSTSRLTGKNNVNEYNLTKYILMVSSSSWKLNLDYVVS